ncbi:MAG TPA: LLM class F420-dependent oxidoreductase [Acidimicrobiales bacterium]|nr:LLM class F420-dependent oxidoreductase [Acidimicrobiales bacterium]
MKFGVAFANVGPFATADGAQVMGQAAEAAGFDSLWTVEHVIVPREYASIYPYAPGGKMPAADRVDMPDPLIWLTWVAAHTTTLRLGTGILILPQRNPVVAAKEVATLDKLSGGRVSLGVGIGWLEEEFRVLNAPWPDRAARTEEYVAAMRALWTQDLPDFDGETVSFRQAISKPRPSQGSVPIVIGGHSAAAARRAGRIGDGFFPAKGDLPALLGEMRKAAEEAGRDPDTIEVTWGGGMVPRGGEQAVDEIGRLAELGVDRVVIPPPAYDPDVLADALAAFCQSVIAAVPGA